MTRRCYNHDMSLYTLMKNFCVDAYRELSQMKQLPRPPYDSPLLARNPYFTHWESRLYKLKSHDELQDYVLASGLQQRLHDVGHTWTWHEEVFEWLFLERLITESEGREIVDNKVFDRVFKRAQAELNRPFFRIRRITALVGVPDLKHPIELSKGVILSPINFAMHHYQLAEMLGWRYQDKHRAPSFWLDSDSRLLIQTRLVKKGGDGKDLFDTREQMRYEARQMVKAFKISLDVTVLEKHRFSSYLSSFPLLPLEHEEIEDTKGLSISNKRFIRRKELNKVRSCYKLICEAERQEPQFFISSVDRFADSFRATQQQQNVVDLIVSLESLFSPGSEELKYRLATYVASLLGTKDSERQRLYNQVSSGYKLRNAIVHGSRSRKDRYDEITNSLLGFFPDLRGKPKSEVAKHMPGAVWQLQSVTRKALAAYVHMRANNPDAMWPDNDELESLLFDSQKLREIQKQLGLI